MSAKTIRVLERVLGAICHATRHRWYATHYGPTDWERLSIEHWTGSTMVYAKDVNLSPES